MPLNEVTTEDGQSIEEILEWICFTSNRHQTAQQTQTDILAAGVRCNDLYVDSGGSGARGFGRSGFRGLRISGARASLDCVLDAHDDRSTLVITTVDSPEQLTQNTLATAADPRGRGASLGTVAGQPLSSRNPTH